MSKLDQHPSEEELAAFKIGLLPVENASIVEKHISDCDSCCETLLNLSSADDTFVGMLQQADAPDEELTMHHHSSMDSTESSVPSSDESIKDLFADHPRYEVISRIARGGMGVVFKAKHRNMKRTVALKVINQSLIRDSQVVKRFHREVQTAARLSHPNIVTAYDAEQANNNHFLVMEYVDGESLAALVKRDHPIPIHDACQYISQVANGLQYAHGQGVVHRDIKPHNLMLSEGTVKILDFGLASLAELTPIKSEHADIPENSSLTAACSIMGTPDFMSPEQAASKSPVDFRSDIYSLGATLYYLLAGQPPFDSGSVAQKLERLADSQPTPIQSLRSDVPQELSDVISRMMAKDPDDRFQSAQEIEIALAPLIDDALPRPIDSVPLSSGRRIGWPFNTTKTIASAAAALLIILLGVVYVETDKGTLVIESVDDTVKVVVSQGRDEAGGAFVQTSVTDTVTGSEVKRLPSGEYKLSLESNENEFELSEGGFVLRRGGQVVVTVSRKQTSEPNGNVDAKTEAKALKKMAFPSMAQGKLIRSGNDLSEDEVKELQAKADSDPDDVESRLQLLGYYYRKRIMTKSLRAPHQKLANWFIRNYPDSAAAGNHAARVMGSMDPTGYVRAKETWLEQINAYDENVTVLMNAAGFFLLEDKEKAEELLKKAQTLEPDNTRITTKLAHLYQLSGRHGYSKSKNRDQNEKAMAQYERALKQTADGPGKPRLVINIAKIAFKLGQMDKAQTFADRLMKEHGGDQEAVHYGNTFLGLLAIEAGEIEAANSYLIESGKTKGSPSLRTSGPSMSLANALLEKGQKDAVLEYFELCEKFWKYPPGMKKLEQWKAAVEAGITPDFGTNLSL